jgi:predicted nucleic acid-binding Zn ribbon protein
MSPSLSPGPKVSPEGVRTLSTGLVVTSCCLVCRQALPPGSRSNRVTCSSRCRRELSRRRVVEAVAEDHRQLRARLTALEARIRQVQGLLGAALKRLEE